MHVERRDQRDLSEQRRERRAPADHVRDVELLAERRRRIGRPLLEQETIGERREVTREDLGVRLIVGGERAGLSLRPCR